MDKGAKLSKDGLYRYNLWRRWNAQRPTLAVCMLNPSTADAERDDPTIRKLIWWAGLWHYGGIEVVNVCAYRTSEPELLFIAQAQGTDIVGPDNMKAISLAVLGRDCLCAWGTNVRKLDLHMKRVRLSLRRNARGLYAVGKTRGGYPVHPLYQLKDQPPPKHFMV